MKRSIIFAIMATAVIAISVAAQTSLTLWPYYVEVKSDKNSPGLYDVVLPLAVLDKAGSALDDLRLFDAANREIPYAIRIRRDINESVSMQTRIFNASRAGAISEASLDLGEDAGEHNEVQIETSGSNYRRRVTVEGSDTNSDWKMLQNNGVIFSFSSRNDAVESDRVSYPTSRYRYLRIRIQRDDLDNEAPGIFSVNAIKAVREQGQLATWGVDVPSYQLERNQGAHASVWNIDLGAYAPCDRLTLQVADDSFSRPFKVEAVDDQDNISLVASGTLTRHSGEKDKPVVIVFNQEERARQLRLQVTDYSNQVLNIISIQASAPARQLLYELKEPVSPPLRLFFGNAKVTAPHYDFANVLPVQRLNEATHSMIGNVITNPDYRPEPKPLTERVPWLIYLVLAASSVALIFILLNLARSAVRAADSPAQT